MQHWKLACALLFLSIGGVSAQALPSVPDPAIVVLDYEGTIYYHRNGWMQAQPLLVGGQVIPDDFIYPEGSTLDVLCPNGEVRRFREYELMPNTRIACETLPDFTAIGYQGALVLDTTRGGMEDLLIPYLIAPRSTLIRQPNLTLVWNPLLDADFYELTLLADGQIIWQSGKLDSSTVIDGPHDEMAEVDVPTTTAGGMVELMPSVAYTVEICAQLIDTRYVCTTDLGQSGSANLAFYYQPIDLVSGLEDQALSHLNQDSAEALYAQGVLLSFPRYAPSTGTEMLGYYGEAIQLLERILDKYPDSELAQSPELLNRLGRLYQLVNLSRSAARDFSAARDLITTQQFVNLDTKVFATLGLAATTPDNNMVVPLYNEAVVDLQQLYTPEEFEFQFPKICHSIGDVCLKLDYCHLHTEDCQQWVYENPSIP